MSSSTQPVSTDEQVVTVDWLYANLKDPGLKVLDASWYMPDGQRSPIQEYQAARVPGALFFDIDRIADLLFNIWTSNQLLHLLIRSDYLIFL